VNPDADDDLSRAGINERMHKNFIATYIDDGRDDDEDEDDDDDGDTTSNLTKYCRDLWRVQPRPPFNSLSYFKYNRHVAYFGQLSPAYLNLGSTADGRYTSTSPTDTDHSGADPNNLGYINKVNRWYPHPTP
jgi:hypothetical protein